MTSPLSTNHRIHGIYSVLPISDEYQACKEKEREPGPQQWLSLNWDQRWYQPSGGDCEISAFSSRYRAQAILLPRRAFAIILWLSPRHAVACRCLICSLMAAEVIPPPYVITAHDKRGLIVVTGAAVLAFVWSCFLIRVWLRWQSREWRSDGEYFTACESACTEKSRV